METPINNIDGNVTTTHLYGNERQEGDSSTTSQTKPIERVLRRNHHPIPSSFDAVVKEQTLEVIQEIMAQGNYTREDTTDIILDALNEFIEGRNYCARSNKWKYLKTMKPVQIALCLVMLDNVRLIRLTDDPNDEDGCVIGVYQDSGPKKGLYDISKTTLKRIIRQYHFTAVEREIDEICAAIPDCTDTLNRCLDPDLVPLNNGIFNYRTKELEDFSPERVFISKCKVDYMPNAQNPVITQPDGTSWDVESWVQSLTDDHPDGAEMAELIFQIIGAMLRCHAPWNKAAFLVSPKGNNGKGTLCELMRSILGKGTYASIPISSFSKEFMLGPLVNVNAIITDENDVGSFMDLAAEFKAAITHDPIPLNRKYKDPISFRFVGFMVQCLNDYPKFKDKSDSLYRRFLVIPMTKCFTGAERKYIKSDYVHRKEVLEYVVYRVLNMEYDELSEPASCRAALEEEIETNDPVRQFMNEMLPRLAWDLVPYIFLYDLYKSWYDKNFPRKQPLAKKNFIRELKNNLDKFPEWVLRLDKSGKDITIRPAKRMERPELLIHEYGLEDWKNLRYSGADLKTICSPNIASRYRGILRARAVDEQIDCDENATEDETKMQPNT